MNFTATHRYFEKKVQSDPAKIAIVSGDETISYLQLNERANRIGHLLMELSPMQGFVVATMLPSGIGLVSSVLGIWKTGGIYLPMDPGFSESRIRQIFDHTSPIVLITNRQWEGQVNKMIHGLGVMPGWVMVLGDAGEIEVTRGNGTERRIVKLEELNDENPGVEVDAESGNYIFYTSGSTGIGKPILGCHKGLSHFIHWQIEEFGLSNDCRVSQLTQITFDASLRDIFVPLITGGTLYIPEASTKSNVEKLLEWIEEKGITLVHCVPSLFRLILKESAHSEKNYGRMRSVRQILMAGEMLYAKDILDWQKNIGNHIELVNLYGTSETTLAKTFHRIKEVPENGSQVMHVGKPISNAAVAIINSDHICKISEIGEIYIKTAFWTKGYYKDPVLTDQVFVQNPLVNDRKDIVYRTGDMGRYLGDRSIEVLGRVDDQVKVNGVRVELGEIEGAVLKMPGVEETVALVHRNANNENELVCYYVGRLVDEDQLRMYLKQELNENIIPGYFVQMESFPLTLNGKVDKKSLPKPEKLLMEGMEYEAVNNETERKLEKIWKEVLGRDRIGRKATFFKIGGTSLKAMQIISRIYRELDVSLFVVDMFSHETIAALGEQVEKAQKEKYEEIPVIEEQLHYALSHAQKRLWVIDQLEGETKTAYNLFNAHVFEGALNRKNLELAFATVVDRHESLRTIFINRAGEPFQKICSKEELGYHLEYIDLREEADPEEAARRISEGESEKGFDLSKGPLIRTKLLQVAREKYIFLLTLHHIISDGWSMEVLVGEILELYQGYEKGEPVVLKPLRIQYKDYAAWQNQLLEEEGIASHRTYWKEKLSGDLPILALPTDYRRPEIKNNNGAIIELHLDKKLQDQFDEQSHQHGVTLFMMLLSTVNVLLHRYTGQEDIIIGTAVAGREHVDLEDQIGFYVNTLALRTQVKGEESFRGLLSHVKEVALGAFEHQVYPFDRLVEELELERDLSRMPVFDVMMSLQNTDGVMAPREFKGIDQVSVSGYAMQSTVSKFDLTFNFQEYESGILLQVNYSTELFSAKRMERMMGHYKRIVEEVLSNGEAQVGKIDYLTKEERKQILKDFNNTYTNYPRNKTVVDIFEEQVKQTPGNTAVVFEDVSLTYEELNRRSNQLAGWLRAQYAIKPGDLIAIMMERSEWLIISILAVLKSGAGYVPLDPSYPEERKRYMIEDAGAKCVLLESGQIPAATESGKDYVDVKGQWDPIGNWDSSNLQAVNQPSDIIYVIYTSGSTGRPKGVIIEHRSLINLVHWHQKAFCVHKSRATMYAGVGFDASAWEIWPYLLNGSCIYPLQEEKKYDSNFLLRFINAHSITHCFLPTRICEEIMGRQDLKRDLWVLTGGEKLVKCDISKIKVINNYGPTENSVVSTYIDLQQNNHSPILPIGKPVANTRIYILNKNLNLQPIGVEGEICISGEGLARAYLNLPDLTKIKFIANPYEPGQKLYKTGDLGKWLEDGNIEYIGRIDTQIKLRGHRIELEEIENVMEEYAGVKKALVVAKGDGGDMYLIAYYKGNKDISDDYIKNYLQEKLPAYMVPLYVVCIAEYPLTESGKLDWNKLPDPLTMKLGKKESDIAPRNETENSLAEIWMKILGLENISMQNDFFELGGNSLDAIRVVSYVAKNLDIEIELADVFNYTTIESLSQVIRSRSKIVYEQIPVANERPYYALSNAQKRFWVIDQTEREKNAYIVPMGFEMDGILDHEALKKAFRTLLERHEILRTGFIVVGGEPMQQIHSVATCEFTIVHEDLRGDADKEAIARQRADEEASTAFNLESAPLMRCRLLQMENDRTILLLILHHIISDGWSMEILVDEITVLYKAYSNGHANPLLPLRIQYKDYAAWQNVQLSDEQMKVHQQYWLNQFKDDIPALKLPFYLKDKANNNDHNDKVVFRLNDEISEALIGIAREENATSFAMLVACFGLLLNGYTGHENIIIGTPASNRDHFSLENQIGLYLNTIALKVVISKEKTFRELLRNVSHSIVEALAHQAYPFDRLVGDLRTDKVLNKNSLFNIMIDMVDNDYFKRNYRENDIEEQIRITPFHFDHHKSKYDITMYCSEEDGHIDVCVEYDTAHYEQGDIIQFANNFQSLVKNIGNDPDQRVSYFSIFEKPVFDPIVPINRFVME